MSSHGKIALPKVGVFDVISPIRREHIRDDSYLNEIESLLDSDEPLFVPGAEPDAFQHKRFFFVFSLFCILGIMLPSLTGTESRVLRAGRPDDLAEHASGPSLRQAEQATQDAENGDVVEGRSTADRTSTAHSLKRGASPSTH